LLFGLLAWSLAKADYQLSSTATGVAAITTNGNTTTFTENDILFSTGDDPNQSLAAVSICLLKVGAPVDNLSFNVYEDVNGNYSGPIYTHTLVNGADLTTSGVMYYFYQFGMQLKPNTRYWIVLIRTGAISAVNYYRTCGTASLIDNNFTLFTYGSATLVLTQEPDTPTMTLFFTSSTTPYTSHEANQEFFWGLAIFISCFFGFYWMFSKKR